MKNLISKEYPLVVSGNTVDAIYYDLRTFLEALVDSIHYGNNRGLRGIWVHGYLGNDTIRISEADMMDRKLTLETAIREVLKKNPLSISIHFYIIDSDVPSNEPAMEFNCFSGTSANKRPLLGRTQYNK